MEFITHFLLVALIFAVIDAIWIGLIANKFYKKNMASLLRDKPNFVPAVIFYAIAVWAILVFAVDPALQADSLGHAISRGALLGLFGYATYDLTNASTIKGWSRKVTLVDMAWGTFVIAATAALSFIIL